MAEFSRQQVLGTLWEGGDFILSRSTDEGTSVLLVAPVSERPAPRMIARLEAHHGRLWVTANAPRGAVFQFTLPI